jgi:hypothetical protein
MDIYNLYVVGAVAAMTLFGLTLGLVSVLTSPR